MNEMKKVLMVAFHYPPYTGSSGVHRTLKFSRYLPEHGWQPIILTAAPSAYPQVGGEQLAEIPPDVPIERAFALDTARHLSVRGFHLRWMALPDRWASWFIGAIWSGLKLVRQHRPDVIWSTYPIATAHLIGYALSRQTALPWIADFRDSMTEDNYPPDVWSRRSYRWIEKRVIKYSSRLVFTAPSARRMYLDRYPKLSPARSLLLPNGYDEEDFRNIRVSSRSEELNGRPTRLVHAGLIYTDERDPSAFFKALSTLKQQQQISSDILRIDLRASGSENYYTKLISRFGIGEIVHLLPALPYQKALQDCADADALLVFQAASCNHQIPAKVYEYLRLHKPILALTPREGDTAAVLCESGGATIVDLADEKSIISVLPEFIKQVRNESHPLPDLKNSRCYTRSRQTYKLARCLDELVSNKGAICKSDSHR